MDKAVFYPHLRVPKAIHGWSAVRMDKGKRHQEMQLDIGYDAVVELEMGQGSLLSIFIVRILGRDVEFTVLVLDRLWVIRDERRTGPCGRGKGSQIQQVSKNSYQWSIG